MQYFEDKRVPRLKTFEKRCPPDELVIFGFKVVYCLSCRAQAIWRQSNSHGNVGELPQRKAVPWSPSLVKTDDCVVALVTRMCQYIGAGKKHS